MRLRYYGGEYRVNAGYFREEQGGFRALGGVLPYLDTGGPAGSCGGERALDGFLEARRLSGFRFSLLTCPARNSVSIEWTCCPGEDTPGVRDVEGVVECGMLPDDRYGRNRLII
jgi:hypothetical protein